MRQGHILFGLLLAIVVSAPALAAFQSVPVSESYGWTFTDSITKKYWFSEASNVCTAWDNSTGVPGVNCSAWSNTTLTGFRCGSTPTYLFKPDDFSVSTISRALSGTALDVLLGGTYNLLDAGVKALAGLAAFNSAYCLNNSEASPADITAFQADLASVNLSVLRGKKNNYAPQPVGNAFSITAQTEQSGEGWRRLEAKLGPNSVLTTVNSAAAWNAGTLAGVTVNGNNLEISQASQGTNNFSDAEHGGEWTINQGTRNITFQNLNTSTPSTQVFTVDSALMTPATQIKNTGNLSFDFVATAHLGTQAILTVCYSSPRVPAGACYDAAYPPPTTYRFEVDCNSQNGNASGSCIPYTCAIDSSVASGCTGPTTIDPNVKYYVTMDIVPAGNLFRVRGFSDAGRATQVWNNTRATGSGTLGNFTLASTAYTATPNQRMWGGVANHTYNGTSLWGTTFYQSAGIWNSTVFTPDGSTVTGFQWLNVTGTNNTAPSGTGWNLSVRGSNTSFAANDTSPAWNQLAPNWTGTSGTAQSLSARTNGSKYFQIQLGLHTDDTAVSPSLASVANYYARLPRQFAALESNVTYAAPGQPVNISVPYRLDDNSTSMARVSGLYNGTSGGNQCSNSTFATGNVSAYCSFAWNASEDGGSPLLVPDLVTNDGALNSTNGSRPISTDSAAPVLDVPAFTNSTSRTFAVNINGSDNVSGLNRTWFSLSNLTNGSFLAGYANTTFVANGSVTLCTTCYGEIRISVQADDLLATAYRHISSASNRSAWFDPPPSLSNFSVVPNGTVTTASPAVQVTVNCNATENVTDLANVFIRVQDPSLTTTDYPATLASGTNASGQWSYNTTITSYGAYSFTCRANDTSTETFTATSAVSLGIVSTGGGSGAPSAPSGAGGGGGGGAETMENNTTAIAKARAQTLPQLVKPIAIDEFLLVSPLNPGEARWSQVWLVPPGLPPPDECLVLPPFKCEIQEKTEPYSVGFSLVVAGPDLGWDRPVAAESTNVTVFMKGLAQPVQGAISIHLINGRSPPLVLVGITVLGSIAYLGYRHSAKKTRNSIAAARARSR